MKTKEQLIEEVEKKMNYLLVQSSIRDIEKVSKELDRMIGKIQYIEKIMSKVEDYNDNQK